MKTRWHVLVIVSWLALMLFLATTHPHKLPVYLLVAPFLLIGVALYGTLVSLHEMLPQKLRGSAGPSRRLLWALLSVGATLLLGLQSIGEFKLLDSLVVVGFVALTYFYITRNRRLEKS